MSHTFWGGTFNPIIPLGDKTIATRLIEKFPVDCLHCVSQTSEGDHYRFTDLFPLLAQIQEHLQKIHAGKITQDRPWLEGA